MRGYVGCPDTELVALCGLEADVAAQLAAELSVPATYATIEDLLAAADAVVSTARWEGQPVGLQEALHAGAAIVATDAGGTGAVVGDAAILVPVGDVASMARALADVLLHAAVRDDLRSRAISRGGELATSADALDAALTAYASVS